MKRFSQLFTTLDETTKTNTKVEALAEYFSSTPHEDSIWAITLLSHRRPKRAVKTSLLKLWAAEEANIPIWLFEETYHIVGDLAETISSILPRIEHSDDQPLRWWISYLNGINLLTENEKKTAILKAWRTLNTAERFIFNKIITGSFRVGVSQKLMVRGLSKAFKLDENAAAHRLMGNWSPDETTIKELLFSENPDDDNSRPYPFYLAYPLENEPASLGNTDEWQAEYKWDGIRGQLVFRGDELFVWSRGEELVTEKYPEYSELLGVIPNGPVIDGEILAYSNGEVLPFQLLQTRIGRKNLTKKLLDASPVVLMAYDLLEYEGKDIREKPLEDRRKLLAEIVAKAQEKSENIVLSESLTFETWEEIEQLREDARAINAEGLMIKRKESTYRVGRKRGDWYKWKVDPYTIDAVLTYAMRGHGRRANLYTDYTFGLWHEGELQTFAKAYSGLTDKELKQVDAFVKKNVVEKFGPVRQVTPELVFELAFEGISPSTRHKSGVAVRFPRIHRWRLDKKPEEANTLEDLKQLIK